MKLKKTKKILKKSLILFICIWLFITQMPINNVFAEETNEEPPVTETDNQEEQEPQEVLEEQENNEEDNQEQEPSEEIEDNEGLLTNLGEGEGEGEGQTPVNIIDLYKGGVKVDAKTINFAEAVDAVNSNKADKIVLLKSFNAKENYIFDKSVEVDLNGKKIIFNTNKSITFNGEQSSIKNGTIVVSSFESNATTAVIAVGSDAELQVDGNISIKSRVAFKLNNNTSVYIKKAEICARNLFESSYNSSKFYIEDEAKMNLVSDLNELTGYGYWRTSNSGTNGSISITGGLFTNNKYPVYESNTTTADLSEYYISEYSDILVSKDPYKYQVVHGGGISFDVKGGTWTDGFTVPNYYDYDEGLELPTDTAISRAGYTFNGWIDIESGLTIINIDPNQTGSMSLYASWTARNNIEYKVKHHYELINEPGVFPDDAEHLFVETFYNGVADETVQPNLIPKDGYATPNKKTKQIAGDGSTVIDYYYRVGLNELVVFSENENKGTVSIKDYPSTSAAIATGDSVTIEANALPGYKFDRWVNNNNPSETSDEVSHKIIMGSESLSYTAYFVIDEESKAWVVKVHSSEETKPSNVCYPKGDYYYYQTIEDAVEYAINGATVIMEGDLEVNESVPIEIEIILDLNNHTISQAEVSKADYILMNKHMIMVTSSGKLTIAGPGKILNDDTDDEYWYVNGSALYNNGGTLVLKDGVNVTTTGRHYPAIMNNTGTLIVNDATITSNSIAIDFAGGDAEINNGAVIKNTNLLKEMEQYYNDDGRRNTLLYGEYSTIGSKVNINGGTFTAKTESIFGSDYTYNYYVTVNGGTFNPSKDGYVMSTSGFCLEFYGGTVNSENYVFGDWSGTIYDGYFNIKNGVVPKSYITCVHGGKFHVYDNNPSKINGLMYNYAAIKNTDSDKNEYEYIVLGKSTIYFDSMGGSDVAVNGIEGYRSRPVENMPDNPTMTGYTFDGWYTERGLVNRFDPTAPLTKEYYYLYAKWKLNPNDSIWGARLITERDSVDEYRKYEKDGIIYYYYWYDENDANEDGWDFSRSFDDACDGETIELLKDINLDNHYYYYTSIDQIDATNLTLDLNNHTLKFKKNYSIFNFNNSLCKKFTIQDGTIIQETDYEYSQSFFESMTGTEVISKNVNYVSNYHTTDEYSRLLLAGMNIKMEIQGGFVSDTITLVDSFTEDNTITIDKDYDFRYAGDAFCHIADSLSIGQAILQDGLYVNDPDLFTDDGYVSIELPDNEKVTRKENTYAYDEVIQQTTYREVDVTYNYKIVPGYEVIFDFNKKDKNNTTLKANVATTEGVGKLTSDQIPSTSPKDGFTFDGWYTDKVGGTKITDLTQETINKDVTYYAHWNTDTFEVNFDLNDGNVGGETELESISVSYKDKYPELPTPTKTGYYFAGWYTVSQDEVEGDMYPPLIEKDSEVLTAANHTLYAHWTVKTITVKLDYNGGSCSLYSNNVDGVTMQIDYDSTFELPEVSRDGYEFAGWYTERTGGTPVDDEDGGKLYSDFPFTTLYAHWTAEERNIVLSGYYRYDSSHALEESQDERIAVTCGEVFGNLLTNPYINYETVSFIGWNTDVVGRGKYITSTDVFDINDFYLGGGTDSDLYLYAIYDYNGTRGYENKTIYFDYGFNNSNVNLSSYYVYNYTEQSPEHISDFYECDGTDHTPGELPVPTRLGYTFNGWEIDNEPITKTSSLNDVFNVNDSSNVKIAVAQWTETTNGINAYFYANGGVFNPGGEIAETEKTVTQTIGSNYSLPSVNPTRTGYRFAGWVLASGSRLTENYTIYAYGDIITNTTSVKVEDCQFVNVVYSTENADSILLVAAWSPSTITYTVRHLYKNPYYDENSTDRYYKEKYYFVNKEEYTVDTGAHVLIKPKEYDGVICNDSNFSEIHEYQSKFDGYVLINEEYDEDKPFELYYDSNYFELTIDYNRDGNFEVEEEEQRSFSDDIMVVNKYYRDVFDDSESRSNYENGADNGTASALRCAKTDDFNRGYTFAKWVDDDGNEIKFYDSTKIYTDQNKPTTMPAEPLTIHAVWTPITYNIEFSKGRYSSQISQAKMANQVVTYGTANDKLNKNIYTREGYDFIGWSREDQYDPSTYEEYEHFNVDVVDCGLIDDNDFANDFTFEAGATVTIYPVWRAKEYTVTFHLDGAVFNDYPYYEIKDDCIIDHAHYSFTWTPLPSDAGWSLTKKGYDFIGWYIDKDGDYPTDGTEDDIYKWYENHSSAFIDKEDRNYHYYTYTKNIDVYLRWDPCTYLFDFGLLFGHEEGTFDINSGESYREWSGQQYLGVLQTFNTNIKFPDFEIFTDEGERSPRTGYDFDGWWLEYYVDDRPIKEKITEDTIIDEDFLEKYEKQMQKEYYQTYRTLPVNSDWKARNDVKYKINIYLQIQDGQRYDYQESLYRQSYPEKPIASYEFTGSARSTIDIYDALDHKKYKYDGFYLQTLQEFETNPAIEFTYSDKYLNVEAYDLQIRKGMVCPDGSTVFNVYYYRNFYPVYIYESRRDAVKITDEYDNTYWQYPDHYDEFQYGATADWDRVADEMKRWRGLSDEFNCFAVIYPSSVQELPTKMPSTELVLVPTYAGDEFTITFDPNGGSFLTDDKPKIKQYYDTLFNVPSEIPTLEGFAFDGWYLKDGTKIERTEDYYVSFRGDRTAYAHWSSPLFEVSIEDYSNDITNGLSIYSNIGDVENRINREYDKTVTIRLLSDAAIHDNASFMASSITFDLNGHTLFCDAASNTDFITFIESDVTITDTSSTKLGKIVSNGHSTICLDNSSFRINAGTIENQSTYEGSTVLFVNNEPGVNVDILGGSLIYNNNEDTTANNPSCIYNANSSTINIGNGTKKDSNIFLTLPEYDEGSIIRNLSNVTINGGIFSAPGGNLGNFNEDDEVSVLSGFFELKDPIEGSGEESPSITDKLIFTGGYFNIENIDAMDHYIDKVNNKVIINSFGGYYGNNTYLYFYEISDRVKTIVHFVVTDPENNLVDDLKYDKVTLNDVYTGDKISKPEIQERLPKVDDTDEYYFEGWTSSRDGNYNVTIISNGFEHTLYSLWTKKKHTLKFTIADESKGIKDPDNVEGTALEPTEIDIKDPGKYPALPPKEAVEEIGRINPKYVFGGWYTSTNKAVKEGDKYKSNGILDGDEIVLHAKWVEADIYIVKMNSISKNNLAVKSLANLVCETDVVYENTDDNFIRIENESIKNYQFSYWEINGEKVIYDSENNKWEYLEREEAVEGEEAQKIAEEKHRVGLNFTEFIKGDGKVVNVNAVYEYIGVQGPLLTVEGYKEDYSVEVTYEEKEPEEPENGDPVEPEKKTFEPEFEESTGLYVVKENIKPGSKVKVIYDNDEQDFSAWTNYSNVIVTSKPTLESVVSVDTTYKLVTKADEGELSENSYYIEFRNYSGLLVKSAIIKDEIQLNKLIEDHSYVPTLIGWKFNYWSIDYTNPVSFDAIKKAAGDAHRTVILRPMYVINTEQKVTVVINYLSGGSPFYSSSFEEQLGGSRYITVPKEKDGHTFSYWKDSDGNILGYTNTYAISIINVNEDLRYEYYACYDETVTSKKAIVVINDVGTTTELEEYQEKNDDGEMETKYREINKIVFSVTRSIPDDCELLEQGIIYSTSSSLSSLEGDDLKNRLIFVRNLDTKAWELQSGIKKYVGASKDKVNVLTVKFDRSGKEENPIYLMGYIIVKYKGADNVEMIYTDYCKTTFRGLVPEEGGDGE